MPGEGYTAYGVNDACPVCQKRCKDMANEHNGNVLLVEVFFVCLRCGTLFVPQSRIKHIFDAATKASEKRIIDP